MRYRVVKYRNKWYVECRGGRGLEPMYYGGYWAKETAMEMMTEFVDRDYPRWSLRRLVYVVRQWLRRNGNEVA